MTEFRQIPGYPDYQVSKDGQILSTRRKEPIMISQKTNKQTHYKEVYLVNAEGRKTIAIHRAILLAWVGIPEDGQHAMHLNDIRDDNRLENLRWGSPAENVQMGTVAKLNIDAVKLIRRSHNQGMKTAELARAFSVSISNIWKITSYKSWTNV